MVQNFSAMSANIRKVVCLTHAYETEHMLHSVDDGAAEVVLRCDLGWHYTVERGRAWDHYFVDEHTQICYIARRT